MGLNYDAQDSGISMEEQGWKGTILARKLAKQTAHQVGICNSVGICFVHYFLPGKQLIREIARHVSIWEFRDLGSHDNSFQNIKDQLCIIDLPPFPYPLLKLLFGSFNKTYWFIYLFQTLRYFHDQTSPVKGNTLMKINAS